MRLRALKLALIASIVIAIDQVTKHLIRSQLDVGSSISVIPNVLSITHVENFGAAFGMLQGGRAVFIVSAIVMTCLIAGIALFSRSVSNFEVGALGLILAGALGNMIDRALFGPVTDFIHATFIDFPVFNVADISISVGTAAFVVWILFVSGRPGSEVSQPDE